MSVYVDELTRYQVRDPQARRHGDQWCHLGADSLDELHKFARQLQMRRPWFQGGRFPHYDLTPKKRERAIRAGALEITRREFVRRVAPPRREATEVAGGCE